VKDLVPSRVNLAQAWAPDTDVTAPASPTDLDDEAFVIEAPGDSLLRQLIEMGEPILVFGSADGLDRLMPTSSVFRALVESGYVSDAQGVISHRSVVESASDLLKLGLAGYGGFYEVPARNPRSVFARFALDDFTEEQVFTAFRVLLEVDGDGKPQMLWEVQKGKRCLIARAASFGLDAANPLSSELRAELEAAQYDVPVAFTTENRGVEF